MIRKDLMRRLRIASDFHARVTRSAEILYHLAREMWLWGIISTPQWESFRALGNDRVTQTSLLLDAAERFLQEWQDEAARTRS